MFAGFVMVTVAAASWGTWTLFLRPTHVSFLLTAPIVFVLMGLFALPFALARPRLAPWDRTTIRWLLANALCDAITLSTFFGALETTTVAIAVLSHYLAPIVIALAAPRLENTRVPGAIPAAVVALGGLVIVLEPWATPPHGALLGTALGVTSAFSYAGNVFCTRRMSERIGATKAMAYHWLLAAVLLAPIGLAARVPLPSMHDLALLGAGAATIGAASGIVFALGLVRIGSARAAVLTFAEPLVAVACGALVWGEDLHPIAALGGALVLGAGIHVARKAR